MVAVRGGSKRGRRFRLLGFLAAAVFALLVVMAPAALAYPDSPPAPLVDPNVKVQVASAGASAQSSQSSRSAGLAFTGSDITELVVIGGVLVGAGTLALVVSRRRAHHALT